jgi:hypothetical protein
MNTDDLTAEQCEKLREQIGPHRLYLRPLLDRMYKRGWSEADELFQLNQGKRQVLGRG